MASCGRLWCSLGLLGLLLSPVSAQRIDVYVDQSLVVFPDIGPQMIDGRVLVPLRGVMEKLGANVTWDPASRTVVGIRGDRTLILKIGDRTAAVNEQPVALDVPAMLLAGRTFVPLRFVSEALGADVKWHGATKTVSITSNGSTPAPAPAPAPETPVETATGEPQIRAFSHDATDGWLSAGERLQVTLTGNPGATASFEIPGALNLTPMTEVQAGQYRGEWTVPAGAELTLSGATVLGRLSVGNRSMLIQAGQPVNIDNLAPTVTGVTPADGSRISTQQPILSAVYSDGAGSGVAPDGVTLSLNGEEINPRGHRPNWALGRVEVTGQQVLYRPDHNLPRETINAVLTLRDRAGNETRRSWTFIVGEGEAVVRALTHTAAGRVEAGDLIQVRLEAQPGGEATFQIGDGPEREMRHTGDGVYEGSYTVRKTDEFKNASVIATFRQNGRAYTIEAVQPVSTEVTRTGLTTPQITAPREGRVTSPLIVRGTADPGANVRLQVDYRTRVLGLFSVSGRLAEQVVEVDADGHWASQPIDLNTSAVGGDARLTITAWALGANDKRSEPATVQVSK